MAREDDDIRAIARCLYETDPYIYPYAYADAEDPAWVETVACGFAAKRNVFSRAHLSVALKGDTIVGVLCTLPCGTALTFAEDLPERLREGDAFHGVNEGYFKPLIEESLDLCGYNVSNLCVAAPYRGLGIGEALLEFGVERYGTSPIYLDVIASNTPAVRLYQKLGFAIQKEYLGFSGSDTPLPCYQMLRMPQKNGEPL